MPMAVGEGKIVPGMLTMSSQVEAASALPQYRPPQPAAELLIRSPVSVPAPAQPSQSTVQASGDHQGDRQSTSVLPISGNRRETPGMLPMSVGGSPPQVPPSETVAPKVSTFQSILIDSTESYPYQLRV